MAPCACTFKARVRHVVHSTDLSCRKVSFWVAPHGEIVIDIKKKKSKEDPQTSGLFASLDYRTIYQLWTTYCALFPWDLMAVRLTHPSSPPASLTQRQGRVETATGTMLPASLFFSASSFPSRCHQGLCKCHGPVLEQEPLLLVPRKGLSLDLSA